MKRIGWGWILLGGFLAELRADAIITSHRSDGVKARGAPARSGPLNGSRSNSAPGDSEQYPANITLHFVRVRSTNDHFCERRNWIILTYKTQHRDRRRRDRWFRGTAKAPRRSHFGTSKYARPRRD